jgi:hypothetical protein
VGVRAVVVADGHTAGQCVPGLGRFMVIRYVSIAARAHGLSQ